MANENLKKLHSSLSKLDKNFTRTYDEFEADMQDPSKRTKLHASLSQKDKGFTRTFDEFSSDMGFAQQPPVAAQPSQTFKIPTMYGNKTTIQPDNQTGYFTPEIEAGTRGESNPNAKVPTPTAGTWFKDLGEGMLGGAQKMVANTAELFDRVQPQNAFREMLFRTINEKNGYAVAEEQRKANNNMQPSIDKLKQEGEQLIQQSHDTYGTIEENGVTRPKDFMDLWKEGNKTGALGNILLEGGKSLPTSVAAFTPAGLAVIGASSFNEKYDAVSKQGLSLPESFINATGTAAFELLSEKIGAGIEKGWLKNLAKTGTEQATRTIKSLVLDFLKTQPKEMLLEGVEEGANQIASTVLDWATNAKELPTTPEGWKSELNDLIKVSVYGAGGGAFGGATMGGGYSAMQVPGILQNQKTREQYKTAVVSPTLPDVDVNDDSNHVASRVSMVQAKQAMDQALQNADFDFDYNIANLPVEEQKQVVEEILSDETTTAEHKQTIINYINAAAVERTMQETRQQAITAQLQQISEQTTQLVNDKTGTILTGTLKGTDQEVSFIKGLSLAVDESNNPIVDVANSDESVYYIDENGETQVTIADNVTINGSTTPEERNNFYAQQIIQTEELRQSAINEAVQQYIQQQEAPTTPQSTQNQFAETSAEELQQALLDIDNAIRSGALSPEQTNEMLRVKTDIDNELSVRKPLATEGEQETIPVGTQAVQPNGNKITILSQNPDASYQVDVEDTQGNITEQTIPAAEANNYFSVTVELPTAEGDNSVQPGQEQQTTQDNSVQYGQPLTPKGEQEVQYPLLNDGTPDFDNMSDEQLFNYNIEQFGQEAAVKDLTDEIASVQKQIAAKEKSMSKAGMKDRIKMRSEAKNMFDRLNVLTSLIPVVQQPVNNQNTQTEQQDIIAETEKQPITPKWEQEPANLTTEDKFRGSDGQESVQSLALSQSESDTQELDSYIAEQEHNTNPTEKQKETGIYPKARVSLQGHNITIETLKGTNRTGIDEGGQKWSVTMQNHYGELDGTIGYDNDPIDVFIGTNPKQGQIFVVDQLKPDGSFDESKVMLGFDSVEQAKAAYMSNYSEGWSGFGSITPAGDNFKEWLYDGKKQKKPFAEYKETPDAVDNGELKVESKEKQFQAENTLTEIIVPKSIKQLESENKTTLPKIPTQNVFLNKISQAPLEKRNKAGEYIDKLNELPTEKINVSDIIPTQKNITIGNLKEVKSINEEPYLLKYGEKYYVVDGHHRIANQILEGNNTIEAKVFDSNEADILNQKLQTGTTLIPTTPAEVAETVEQLLKTGLAKQVRMVTPEEMATFLDGNVQFHKAIGGNSGYVGYSMSKRAASARENGKFPKTDFKKEYSVTENSLSSLVDAGIINNREWHHTSKFGNKTTFYQWTEDYHQDIYAENKKEIDKISNDKTLSRNQTSEKINAIFENNEIAKQAEEQRAIAWEEMRKKQEAWSAYDTNVRNKQKEISEVISKMNDEFIQNLPQDKIKTNQQSLNTFYNASNGSGVQVVPNELNKPFWLNSHISKLANSNSNYKDSSKNARIEYLQEANKAYSKIDQSLFAEKERLENELSAIKKAENPYIQFLRTPSGTIYGFVKDKIVHLNSETPNLNTPIHEFGHLWVDAIEGSELYNRGAELIRDTTYWQRVNSDPNYKDLSEPMRTKEAMAMAIGDKGEAVKQNLGLYARIKTWINDVWQRIGAQFGIQNLTPEQIQNLTFNDFVEVAVSELMAGEPLTPKGEQDRKLPTEKDMEMEGSKRNVLRVDENGRNIVWENDNYMISVNDPENATYIVLWNNGKKVGELFTTKGRNSATNGYLSVQNIEIDKQHRGKGLSSKMYDALLNHLGEKYKGISSENEQRVNKKQVPQIWKRLNANEIDGNYTVDKKQLSPTQIKSATSNDGSFDPNEPDIRFQIIGEQGAAALDATEEATTRLDNLRVAKEMEKGIPYVYHGTSKGALSRIINEGLKTGVNREGAGINFTNNETYAKSYADRKGSYNPIMLRTAKKESYKVDVSVVNKKNNEDYITHENVPASALEIKVDNNWTPLSNYDFYENKLIDNSLISKELKQFTPQEIRLATGWEKGVDGLWRYEVPDGEFAYGYYDLIQKGGMKRLSDIFENTEIFKAYPELNNIAVMTDNIGEISGSYSNKIITLNRDKFGKIDMLSVLIHEIQHAIQEIEGFAKGGNTESIRPEMLQYPMMIKKAQEKIDDYYQNHPDGIAIDKESDEWLESNTNPTEEEYAEFEAKMKAKYPSVNSISQYTEIIKQQRQNPKTREEAYKRLAGETEARNASNRMNMSEEERRNTLLSETADVAPEDQIVLLENMGVSMSEPTKPEFTGNMVKYAKELTAYNQAIQAIKDKRKELLKLKNEGTLNEKDFKAQRTTLNDEQFGLEMRKQRIVAGTSVPSDFDAVSIDAEETTKQETAVPATHAQKLLIKRNRAKEYAMRKLEAIAHENNTAIDLSLTALNTPDNIAHNLQVAKMQEQSGADAQSILVNTGWTKTPNGEWQFEKYDLAENQLPLYEKDFYSGLDYFVQKNGNAGSIKANIENYVNHINAKAREKATALESERISTITDENLEEYDADREAAILAQAMGSIDELNELERKEKEEIQKLAAENTDVSDLMKQLAERRKTSGNKLQTKIQSVSQEISDYIRTVVGKDIVDVMSEREFKSLIAKLEKATSSGSMRTAMKAVNQAIQQIVVRKNKNILKGFVNGKILNTFYLYELDAAVRTNNQITPEYANLIDNDLMNTLSNLNSYNRYFEIQSKNKQGVSISRNVDEGTRQIMQFVRDYKDLSREQIIDIETELNEDRSTLNAKNVDNLPEEAKQRIKRELLKNERKQIAIEQLKRLADIKDIEVDIKLLKDTDYQDEVFNEQAKWEVILERQKDLERVQMESIRNFATLLDTGRSLLAQWKQAEQAHNDAIAAEALAAVTDKQVKTQGEEKADPTIKKRNLLSTWWRTPLTSFEFMLSNIDRNHPTGEGAMYRRWMPELTQASDKFHNGYNKFRADVKVAVKDIFGMKLEKFTKDTRKDSGITITYKVADSEIEGEAPRTETIPMTKGELMYVWLTWQHADGREKLESMSLTEADIKIIEQTLGENYIAFAHWTQNHLNENRERYNETHNAVFGTSMGKIKNYFPLKYPASEITPKSSVDEINPQLPSIMEGAIVNRVRTKKPINLAENFLDTLMEHGENMESWNAYAKLRKDLNALLKNKELKKRLDVNSPELYDEFVEATKIAVKANQPKPVNSELAIMRAVSRLQGAAIAGRINTALKQGTALVSYVFYNANPAYYAYLIKNLKNAVQAKKSIEWAKQKLPTYAERLGLGNFGNEKLVVDKWENSLQAKGIDRVDKITKAVSKITNKKIKLEKVNRDVDKVSNAIIRSGMFFNKWTDGYIFAIGSHAIYEYEKQRYLKAGLDEAVAEQRALFDAANYSNKVSQSSNPAYLAPVQKSKTFWAQSFTAFMNANFAFGRNVHESTTQLARAAKQVVTLANENEASGMTPEAAKKHAQQTVLNANGKAVLHLIYSGLIANFTFQMFDTVFSSFMGGGEDDEDEKRKKLVNAAWKSPLSNVFGGSTIISIIEGFEPKGLLDSEISKAIRELRTEAKEGFSTEIARLSVQYSIKFGLGLNIETLTNIYTGIEKGIVEDGGAVMAYQYITNVPKTVRVETAKNTLKPGESIAEYAKRVSDAYDRELKSEEMKEVILKKVFSDNGDMTGFNRMNKLAKEWHKLQSDEKDVDEKSERYKELEQMDNEQELTSFYHFITNSVKYYKQMMKENQPVPEDETKEYKKISDELINAFENK